MPYKINDLDSVFDNIDACDKTFFSIKKTKKDSNLLIFIAGAVAFRGNLTDEQIASFLERADSINAEWKAQTGRLKIVEFETYQDLAQLAAW